MADPFKLVWRDGVGEIHERSRDGRDRQAVALANDVIEGIQRVSLVHPQLPTRHAPAHRRDIERTRRRGRQIPSGGRRPVTEHRHVGAAAGEHGGPPPTPGSQASMADRVDTAVHSMQPPSP